MKILQLALLILVLAFQGCFDSGKKEKLNLDYITPVGWESSYGIHSYAKTLRPKVDPKGDISLYRKNIDTYCKKNNCKKSAEAYTLGDFIATEYAWHNEENLGKELNITKPTDTTLLNLPAKEFVYDYMGTDNHKGYGKKIFALHGKYVYSIAYDSPFENRDLYNKELKEIKNSLKILDESRDF